MYRIIVWVHGGTGSIIGDISGDFRRSYDDLNYRTELEIYHTWYASNSLPNSRILHPQQQKKTSFFTQCACSHVQTIRTPFSSITPTGIKDRTRCTSRTYIRDHGLHCSDELLLMWEQQQQQQQQQQRIIVYGQDDKKVWRMCSSWVRLWILRYLFFSYLSSGGRVKAISKLPHFHVTRTCHVWWV